MTQVLFKSLIKCHAFLNLIFIGILIPNIALCQERNTDSTPVSQEKATTNTESAQTIDDWSEDFHHSVSNSVHQSATWFDSFFTEDENDQESPRTSARIRLEWKPKARDWNEFNPRFRIKLKLPHLKNRMSLILSDENDINQSQLPLESVNTRPQTNEDSFAAAIRYVHKSQLDRLTDSRVGITGGDIFVKARHKRKYIWSVRHGIKVEPSIYYYLDDGAGARLLLEYDYQLDEKSQFRINYSIRGSESFSGIRWKHGFYKLKQLDHNAATVFGFQVEGKRNAESSFIIDNYTLSYRYRFNAVKKWLFFEIEPFLEWPENENYSTTPGIALRVEGYFNKS